MLGLGSDYVDALFYGRHHGTADELKPLKKLPKAEVLRALDRILAGAEPKDIWDPPAAPPVAPESGR